MRILFISALLSLTPFSAHASSASAWADFESAVTEACGEASQLDQAAVSSIIGFDDTLGKVAVLVTGVFPQAYMKGATGTMLCIYDKQTSQTWIDEATGWSAGVTD